MQVEVRVRDRMAGSALGVEDRLDIPSQRDLPFARRQPGGGRRGAKPGSSYSEAGGGNRDHGDDG